MAATSIGFCHPGQHPAGLTGARMFGRRSLSTLRFPCGRDPRFHPKCAPTRMCPAHRNAGPAGATRRPVYCQLPMLAWSARCVSGTLTHFLCTRTTATIQPCLCSNSGMAVLAWAWASTAAMPSVTPWAVAQVLALYRAGMPLLRSRKRSRALPCTATVVAGREFSWPFTHQAKTLSSF